MFNQNNSFILKFLIEIEGKIYMDIGVFSSHSRIGDYPPFFSLVHGLPLLISYTSFLYDRYACVSTSIRMGDQSYSEISIHTFHWYLLVWSTELSL